MDGAAPHRFFDLRNVCIKAVETNSILFVRFLVENAQDRKINNRVHSRFREFLPKVPINAVAGKVGIEHDCITMSAPRPE